MIVLVDTSVWIRFLSNRAPYAAELDALLSRDEVSGHERPTSAPPTHYARQENHLGLVGSPTAESNIHDV
jgi:hypothetical protein